MNAAAAAFFAANPDEPYWYYSATLRLPRRELLRQPGYVPHPWPIHPTKES